MMNYLKKTLNQDRLKTMKLKDINNWEDLSIRYKLTHVLVPRGDFNQIIKISKIRENDLIFPIFLTQEVLRRGGDIKYTNQKVRANIDEEHMSVYLGKSKLFTLPFWKCKQYDNMSYDGKVVINNVYLKDLLNHRIIEKYVCNHYNKNIDKINLFKLKKEKYKEFIIEEIKNHKIYDIDYSNVIKTENQILKDIFICTPKLEKNL